MRRQGRIPTRGDRAKFATAREIEACECGNGGGGMKLAKTALAPQNRPSSAPEKRGCPTRRRSATEFFNGIRHKETFALIFVAQH